MLLVRPSDLVGALAIFVKAVHLGYDDSQWMDTDPDLNNVRTDPRYQRIRRQLEVKFSSH